MIDRLVEDMSAIRDANQILIELVCDPGLPLQGLMILDRVQMVFVRRQFQILQELNGSIRRHELSIVRGMVQ